MTSLRTSLVLALGAALAVLLVAGYASAGDPFAAGDDALAVKDGDGSSSVRAKLALKKMKPDMIMVRVRGLNDKRYPNCVVTAQILKAAQKKTKHFKLLGRGKQYRFMAVLKKRGRSVNLNHKMTQNNLGLCYYPKNSKLILRIQGVDLKKKVFKASEVYLK
ncbi:MAG: hypothetical protein KC503_33055 [Myxococcales bacterium]|nr:hypothetical protein [Myxococcales bacterium]